MLVSVCEGDVGPSVGPSTALTSRSGDLHATVSRGEEVPCPSGRVTGPE